MLEREFNKIFSERLRYYLAKYEITQHELSKRLGVGTTSVYNWCNGIKTPRMDKVDAMCQIFNCKRSDLMEEKTERTEDVLLDSIASRYGQDCAEAIEIYLKFHEDERKKLNSLLAEYYKLDEIDRAEVRGRIMQFVENMLDSDKYSAQEELKHA